jgi:hypothetical protein
MKKKYFLLLYAVLISSCSFLSTVPPTVGPIFTSSPTNVPTSTPTVPTPTFTLTPSLVALNTKTSTPDFTFTPTLLMDTPSPTMTALVLVTNVPIPGFVNISVSDKEFYKGKKCLPNSVKFNVQVANPAGTSYVVLFVRFKSKVGDIASRWTSITMQPIGAGTYQYELTSDVMKAVDLFENAWVQYQLVATDADSVEVGHTDIFSEKLTLLECVPTLTPSPLLSPSPTVTPTVAALKP